METVLTQLGPFARNEHDPRRAVDLGPNLQHDRAIVDYYPTQRLTPPTTKRHRVTRSDNDLLPLKTHDRNLATP